MGGLAGLATEPWPRPIQQQSRGGGQGAGRGRGLILPSKTWRTARRLTLAAGNLGRGEIAMG
jgi:hypothetical protein